MTSESKSYGNTSAFDKRKSVCMVSIHSYDDPDLVYQLKLQKQAYACTHKMDYFEPNLLAYKTKYPLLETAWFKLLALLDLMEADVNNEVYEWYYWVDGDVVFTNITLDIRDHITDDADFIWAGNNTGVFLVKNTVWSRLFLRKAFDMWPVMWKGGPRPAEGLMENAAIGNLTLHWAGAVGKITSYPKPSTRLFQSYCVTRWFEEFAWKPGDFIMHLPGMDPKWKPSVLKHCLMSPARCYEACNRYAIRTYNNDTNAFRLPPHEVPVRGSAANTYGSFPARCRPPRGSDDDRKKEQ